MNDKMGETLFRQVMDLWVNPEVEKRVANGSLQKGTIIHFIQIIFDIKKDNEVRFNEEVKCVFSSRPSSAVNKGDIVVLSDLKSIEDVILLEEDENSAHITMLNIEGSWKIFFDFRYNAAIINSHLNAAKEFLDTASDSLINKRYRAFVDNLYSSCELISKSWLFTTPDKKLLDNKRHKYVFTQINKHKKLGNINSGFVKVFNQLSSLRASARYLNFNFTPDKIEYDEMYSVVKLMYESVIKDAPKRYSKSGIEDN